MLTATLASSLCFGCNAFGDASRPEPSASGGAGGAVDGGAGAGGLAGAAGFPGSSCEGVTCDHGACVAQDGTAECACDDGWSGDRCDAIAPLPADGLTLWLDADDAARVTAVGGKVSGWADKGPLGYSALQPVDDERPAATSSGGRTVLAFDGNDWLGIAGFNGLTGRVEYTVFFVGFARGVRQDFLSLANSGQGHGLLAETVGTRNLRFLHRSPIGQSGGDNATTMTGPLSESALQVVALVRSTTSMEVWIDGVLASEAPTATGPFDQTLDLAIGRVALDNADRELDGQLGEVLVYGRLLSNAERRAVELQLGTKWLGTEIP